MQSAVPALCICLVMCDAIAPACSTLGRGRPSESMCEQIIVAPLACQGAGGRAAIARMHMCLWQVRGFALAA